MNSLNSDRLLISTFGKMLSEVKCWCFLKFLVLYSCSSINSDNLSLMANLLCKSQSNCRWAPEHPGVEMPPLSLDILAEIRLLVVWLIHSKLTGAGFFIHLKSIFHSFESIKVFAFCLSRNMSYVVSNLGMRSCQQQAYLGLSLKPRYLFPWLYAKSFYFLFPESPAGPSLSTPLLQLLHTFLMQITVNLGQLSPHLISTSPWSQGNPSKMQVKDKLKIRTDFATFILSSVQFSSVDSFLFKNKVPPLMT